MKLFSRLAFVVAATIASVGSFAPVASAQTSTTSQSETLGVRIVQAAAGGDHVQIYGLDDDSSTLSSNSNTGGLDYFGSSFNLVRSIGDNLNINRSLSHLSEPVDSDGGNYPDTEVDIHAHERFFATAGDNLTLNIDTSLLSVTAARYGYSDIELAVCPLKVSFTNNSSAPRSDYDTSTGCSYWEQAASQLPSNPVQLKFVESPNDSNYWSMVSSLVISVLIATLVLGIPTYFLRRHALSRLRNANLALIVAGSLLAWLSAIIAMIAIYDAAHSINDLALVNAYSQADQVLAAVLPGLLFAIPFLIPVILLATVPPPDYVGVPAPAQYGAPMAPMPPSGGPGLPSWLNGPGVTASPAYQQPVPQQAPQQAPQQVPQRWGPPPTPQWWGQPQQSQPQQPQPQQPQTEAPQNPPVANEPPAAPEPQQPPASPPVSPPPVSPPTWHPPA